MIKSIFEKKKKKQIWEANPFQFKLLWLVPDVGHLCKVVFVQSIRVFAHSHISENTFQKQISTFFYFILFLLWELKKKKKGWRGISENDVIEEGEMGFENWKTRK